ncbi:hypothetical protein ACFL5V_09240 [Fibrobacterota bacterium]
MVTLGFLLILVVIVGIMFYLNLTINEFENKFSQFAEIIQRRFRGPPGSETTGQQEDKERGQDTEKEKTETGEV